VLLQHPGEATYPTDMMTYFKLVWDVACKGIYVKDGHYTQLGGKFLGGLDNNGFVYTRHRTQSLSTQVPLKEKTNYLFAVLLKPGEVMWAKCMSTRILLRLGEHYRYYPCPIWSERKRADLFPAGLGQSLISATPVLHIDGVFIMKQGNKLIVKIPEDGQQELINDLNAVAQQAQGQDVPITLHAGINLEADSHLVHVQGNSEPQAICLPGSTGQVMGATFVTFLPLDEGGLPTPFSLVEDGWVVQLPTLRFTELVAALNNKSGFTFGKAGDETWLEIVIYQRDFINPIDGSVLRADWKTYKPEGEEKPGRKGFDMRSITLLTEDNALGRCIDPSVLATFINELAKLVIQTHKQWIQQHIAKETQEKTEEKNEKETEEQKEDEKKEEDEAKMIEEKEKQLLGYDELVLQVELNVNKKIILKAGLKRDQGKEEANDYPVQFIETSLQKHFEESKEAIPELIKGPAAFMMHFGINS